MLPSVELCDVETSLPTRWSASLLWVPQATLKKMIPHLATDSAVSDLLR